MDYNSLKILAEEHTLDEIAAIIGCSKSKIKYWVKKHNLSTRKIKNPCCIYCGETDASKMMLMGKGRISKNRCKTCHNQKTIERGQENKQRLLDHYGGKCKACGYDECMRALDFHHPESADKDPSFEGIRYWDFERAIIELDKCVLLCSNCHRKEHCSLEGPCVKRDHASFAS